MDVRELLNNKPGRIISVSPETTGAEAANIMAEHSVGVAVVTDQNGKLVGVISERDIVAAVGANAGTLEDFVVGQLMTPSVITCDATDVVLDAIRKMYSHSIRHIIVMDGEELAGVVSLRDVLDAMFIRIEERERAVHGNLAG